MDNSIDSNSAEQLPTCLCCRKFIHFLYSYKPMILLFYALYSDVSGLLDDMIYAGAFYDDGVNWGLSCDDGKAVVMQTCPEGYSGHPLYILALVVIALSSIYGLGILIFTFYKSPNYPELQYYAFIVMSKRKRYFKHFINSMYGVLCFMVFLYLIGMIVLYAITGAFSPSFLGSVFQTMLIAGIAVSELRSTNEIHFQYTTYDGNKEKPIYLSPPINKCGCTLITAEDVFERLEEAVNLYTVTQQKYLLQQILLNPSDEEINRVIKYYEYIYNDNDKHQLQDTVNKSIELNVTQPPNNTNKVLLKVASVSYDPVHIIDIESNNIESNNIEPVQLVVLPESNNIESNTIESNTIESNNIVVLPESNNNNANQFDNNNSVNVQQSKLPDGWEEVQTNDGKVYYQNNITKTTQWKRPGANNTANNNEINKSSYGQEIIQFFSGISLNKQDAEKYYNIFVLNGIESLETAQTLNDQDLIDIGVVIEDHRKIILLHLQEKK